MVQNHSDMGFKDIEIKDQTVNTDDIEEYWIWSKWLYNETAVIELLKYNETKLIIDFFWEMDEASFLLSRTDRRKPAMLTWKVETSTA